MTELILNSDSVVSESQLSNLLKQIVGQYHAHSDELQYTLVT